mmetsp:Transcript_23227/g.58957  ORF Transcript_23227/g.58957 Transcript_23227/m.58957 type:complete len:217 (+) Transcript_23227:460-1110(+)
MAGSGAAELLAHAPTALEVDPSERERLVGFAAAVSLLDIIFLGGVRESSGGPGMSGISIDLVCLDGTSTGEGSPWSPAARSSVAAAADSALPATPAPRCRPHSAPSSPGSGAGAHTTPDGSMGIMPVEAAGVPTFESLCLIAENAPFGQMVQAHARKICAIGADDEMHLAALADLPAFYAQLRACRRPAQLVVQWLQAGAKRRKRGGNGPRLSTSR